METATGYGPVAVLLSLTAAVHAVFLTAAIILVAAFVTVVAGLRAGRRLAV